MVKIVSHRQLVPLDGHEATQRVVSQGATRFLIGANAVLEGPVLAANPFPALSTSNWASGALSVECVYPIRLPLDENLTRYDPRVQTTWIGPAGHEPARGVAGVCTFSDWRGRSSRRTTDWRLSIPCSRHHRLVGPSPLGCSAHAQAGRGQARASPGTISRVCGPCSI